MRKSVVVVALIFVCISSSLASSLYSIVTEFSENEQETAIFTVTIDRTSGKVTNVTENFVFAGGSATVDGISSFDQKRGRYWFATDAATAFIYGSDVQKKQPLPTLDIGATSIYDLAYDQVNDRLYTIFLSKAGLYLAAIGPQTLQPVLLIPSKYNAGYIMKGTVDPDTATYYLTAKIGSTTQPTYAVVTIDLSTNSIVKEVAIDNKTCVLFPEYIWFDSASGNVFAGAEAFVGNQLQYFFMKVDPNTGACTKTQLQTPVGIITDWSYDVTTNQLWFAEATNSGALLISYNVKTGAQTTPVTVANGLVPESIEVSLNF